jgi:putative membrane protein
LETPILSLVTDWDIPWGMTGILVLVSITYVRGWGALRRTRPKTLPTWRLIAFLSGMTSLFVAIASPLDTFSETLLFMHMAQHFVLMSVAPPLIVMGSPIVPILRGMPGWIIRKIGGPMFRSSALRKLRHRLDGLGVAWLSMNLAYVCWHIPRAYEFALSSEGWHNVEHLCFFLTSILFWWPIALPWPSRRRFETWILIPYLLTADLVNTAVSALLCFSGRLLYPSYAFVERPFGINPLTDQIAAGALMWVCGSIIFLMPAAVLTMRSLTSRRLVQPVYSTERSHQSLVLRRMIRRSPRLPLT